MARAPTLVMGSRVGSTPDGWSTRSANGTMNGYAARTSGSDATASRVAASNAGSFASTAASGLNEVAR